MYDADSEVNGAAGSYSSPSHRSTFSMPPINTRKRFIPRCVCPPPGPTHIYSAKRKGKKDMQVDLPRSCSPLCTLAVSIIDMPSRDHLPIRSAHAASHIPNHISTRPLHPHISPSRRALVHTIENMQGKKRKKETAKHYLRRIEGLLWMLTDVLPTSKCANELVMTINLLLSGLKCNVDVE